MIPVNFDLKRQSNVVFTYVSPELTYDSHWQACTIFCRNGSRSVCIYRHTKCIGKLDAKFVWHGFAGCTTHSWHERLDVYHWWTLMLTFLSRIFNQLPWLHYTDKAGTIDVCRVCVGITYDRGNLNTGMLFLFWQIIKKSGFFQVLPVVFYSACTWSHTSYFLLTMIKIRRVLN